MGSGNGGQYIHTHLLEDRELYLHDESKNTYKTAHANKRVGSTLDENCKSLIAKYGIDEFGRFGEKGNNCRVIRTNEPVNTARNFFSIASKDGDIRALGNNQYGKLATLSDGSQISYREITKTPDSPAVEIIVSRSERIAEQKIHFILEE